MYVAAPQPPWVGSTHAPGMRPEILTTPKPSTLQLRGDVHKRGQLIEINLTPMRSHRALYAPEPL